MTLGCWGFSAEGVNFGADRIVGFNSYDEALVMLRDLVVEKRDGSLPLGVESTSPALRGRAAS